MTHCAWSTLIVAGLSTAAASQVTASSPHAASAPSTPLDRADQLARTGAYDQALALYDRLARDDPSRRLAAAIGAADVLAQTGHTAEAPNRLANVRDAGRSGAAWHVARARLLEAMGRYSEAIEACQSAMGVDPDHFEARYRCGRLYELTGQRDRALALYGFFDRLARQRVPDRAEELVWHGRGFYRYSVLTQHSNLAARTRYVLHELFQPACAVKDPQYWPARIASAELLLSKYNLAEAAEDFGAALKINPKLPAARAGLAAIALEQWKFEDCEKHLARALEVNPKHAPARNLLVQLRLTERKDRQAADEAERTLQSNPRDLLALSLAAAAHVRLDDEQAAARYEARVNEVNPRCALLHHTVAEWLSAARQFSEAERRYLRAIELDPTWSDPQTALGLMYMQWGREDRARTTLDAAWKLDRFNAKTYNVRQLLGQLEAFKHVESDHFILKFDADEDPVLPLYVLDYLESIWPELCRAYDYTPTDKTIVEVFPSHRSFSVRVTSKPWIHTIGASTGRVIAMTAPRRGADLTGPFDWARVLRHELTHTITLAATRNRIPHWFTEALAVRQEGAPLSFRWMVLLARALRRDALFTLDEIDWAFIRPRRPGAREQAYAQSRWMADYIVAEHGHAAIPKMLARFRAGETTIEVIRAVCGLSPSEFAAGFRKWAAEEVQTWGLSVDPIPPIEQLRRAAEQRPNDAGAHAALAEALLYDGKSDQAGAAARRALALDDENVLALTVRCTVLMDSWRRHAQPAARGELAREGEPLLERLARVDPDNRVAPRYLALLAMDAEDFAAARPWLERLRRVSPHDPVAHQGLAALHLKQGRSAKALGELTALAPVEEHDPLLPVKIAELCGRLGRDAEAARWLLRAVRIAPYDAEIHEQLAGLSVKLNDTSAAIREYRALGELQPTRSEHFARLALLYKKAGQLEPARQAARRAVRLDPDSPVRALLDGDL